MMDLKMEVYSPFLELLGLLEIQNSVMWGNKAFSAGSFTLNSLITEESKTLLVPENIIWIAGDDAGIIEYVQQETGEDGPYITVKGCNLTGALGRYILWGPYNLTGPVPEIMRRLVDNCCIHPTLGDFPETRIIPNLVLSDEIAASGPSIRSQKTGGNLLDALEELGTAYGVPFGVRFNPAVPQMEFWARYGVNRSIHQNNVEPVFYSTELDDVLSSEYSYNSQNWRNVALVAGEGEGNDRVMVIVNGDVEPAPEPPTPPTPTKYTITLSVDPEGGGTASGGGTFTEGQSVTVTATASSGYEFAGWQENSAVVNTDLSYTFTVTADRALTAVFAVIVPTYTVSASIDPAGSGTVTGAGQYKAGTQVTLVAVPGEGYNFTGWQENGATVSESAEYTFAANSNRGLIAVFKVSKEPVGLPEGYTEVLYISNPQFSYIRNPHIPDTWYKNIAELKIKVDDSAPGGTIFGAWRNNRKSSLTYSFYGATISVNANNISIEVGENKSFYTAPSNAKKSFDISDISSEVMLITFDFTGNIITANRKTFDNIGITVPSTAPPSPPLFALTSVSTNSSGGNWSYGASRANYKLYGLKFYDKLSGDLILNYVPCINQSGAVGLYELVTNRFYTSYESGKPFTAGPAV